ncbi:MAG: hypothetical protein LBU60_00425 [Clostridiales bacterium]|nr:hypothetical protein [Clostridiales bacterium]
MMTNLEQKNSLNASAKRHSIYAKLTVFILALVLPVSTVMIANLQTKYAKLPVVNMQTQIAYNHQKMHQANRAYLSGLQAEFYSDDKMSRINPDGVQAQDMFDLGFSVLDMLEADRDNQEVFDYFFEHLSADMQQEMLTLLQALFGNRDDSQVGDGQTTSDTVRGATARGWYNTHLVIAMDIGYATGTLAGWLIGVYLAYCFSPIIAALGIVGLIGVAVLAAIVGTVVELIINDIVYKWSGIIPKFRQVLFTIGIWWLWGGGDTDINLIDILLLVVAGIGGQIKPGSRPSGVPAPTFA